MRADSIRFCAALLLALFLLSVPAAGAFAVSAPGAPFEVTVSYLDGKALIGVTAYEGSEDDILYYEYKIDDGGFTPVYNRSSFELTRSRDCSVTVRAFSSGGLSEAVRVDVAIPKDTTLSDKESGVSVSFAPGTDDPDELSVGLINEGYYYSIAVQKSGGNSFVLYDTAIFKDGSVTDVAGTLRWTVQIPEEFAGDPCLLYSIDHDGTASPIMHSPEGSVMRFETSKPMMFLIIDAWRIAGQGKGDVNGDGRIDPADARLALRISVGLSKVISSSYDAADYDSDGTVTAADARAILRKAVGLD